MRMLRPEERNTAVVWAHAAVDALAQSGLRDVFISPGSRSTPLVAALVEETRVRDHNVIDERSAAFCALGAAQASRRPVALLCTSGTATANYLPAVCEAHEAGVPLVVLTADRPPTLRESGSSQSMRQVGLYGDHVRWSHDVAMPTADPDGLAYVRSIVRRAFAIAMDLAGPVHLNFPFAKPLEPIRGSDAASGPARFRAGDSRGAVYQGGGRVPDSVAVTDLVRRLESAVRPVILVGSLRHGDEIAPVLGDVARRLGAPVVAEATSQLRFGPLHGSVVPGDVVFANPELAGTLRPDLVLRLGLPPLNWPVKDWYVGLHTERIVVHPRHGVDPTHDADAYFVCDEAAFLEAIRRRLPAVAPPSEWWNTLSAQGARAQDWVHARMSTGPLVDARVAYEVARATPAGGTLVVSSSMPLREVEAFAMPRPAPMRVFCNRGLNGIDGVISTAHGVALTHSEPTVVLVGDVAASHDIGALREVARAEESLTIVVVDNGGGAIFDHLPVAGMAPMFDRHFTTDPGVAWTAVGEAFGCRVTAVKDADVLSRALRNAVERQGTDLVVVDTERSASREFRSAVLAEFPSTSCDYGQ